MAVSVSDKINQLNAVNAQPSLLQEAPDEAEPSFQELQNFLIDIDATDPEELTTITDKFMCRPTAENAEKGVLSAESILSSTVVSPTGAPIISTLRITPEIIEGFTALRTFKQTSLYARLRKLVKGAQATYGNHPAVGNISFNGLRAVVDPLLLSSYVPYAENVEDLSEDQIFECLHPLQEVDGYPTVQGMPIWERQEWERIDYYNAFKLYRDMRYAFYNESDSLLVNRSLATLAKAIRVPVGTISYLAEVYLWSYRVALYDDWMSMMQVHRAAVKRSLMLDRHSKISQALIGKAFNYLNKNVEKMNPKEALEMLKLGLTYERLSMDMPGDKPAGPAEIGRNGDVNVNISSGPMQINHGSSDQTKSLDSSMKNQDTLLSVLSVLQRSGAFEVLLSKQTADDEPIDVIDVEESSTTPVEEE